MNRHITPHTDFFLKPVIKKLKNDKGVSVIMALLMFLITVMLAAVILTGATVSSGRIAQYPEQEKAYYMVISSINAVNDEIKDTDINYNTKTGTYIASDRIDVMESFIREGILYVASNEREYKSSIALEIPMDKTTFRVSGVFKMDTDYNIQITLAADANDTGMDINARSYITTINFEATRLDNDGEILKIHWTQGELCSIGSETLESD